MSRLRPRDGALPPALLLGINFLVCAGGLVYVLYRFGVPAAALLAREPEPRLLVAFGVAVAAAYAGYALRWRIVLGGVGTCPSLRRLTTYRAAGHSLSSLLPSAKLGGEPLRVSLLVRASVPASSAIASVVVDRTLEMVGSAPFALCYAALLLRRGVPELEGALVTVGTAVGALAVGVVLAVRRLRKRSGLVTAAARATGLDRLRVVRGRMDVLARAEDDASRLVRQPRRLARALAVGVGVNLVVLAEYRLLLAAFGLPHDPLAVVAAVFATGAAHSLPVPAAVGALEGAEMWVFGMLGYAPATGLAVGLAVRLRELVWVVPGLLYLAGRGWNRAADRVGSPHERRGEVAA